MLTEDARPATVQAAYDALSALEPFDHAAVEAALRAALVDGLGLKPKLAFGPVRVAVTGRRISPPLFESIELLGRERTLRRLASRPSWSLSPTATAGVRLGLGPARGHGYHRRVDGPEGSKALGVWGNWQPN